MKWREPWRVSLRHQPRFNPLDKAVRKQFLWFAFTFTVLFVILSWGKDAAGWREQLKLLPLVMLLMPAVLALLVRGVTWMSRRQISSGPGGLLVRKAEDVIVIPWEAITAYGFVSVEGDAALVIVDGMGAQFPLFMPTDVSRAAIERELREKTSKRAETISGYSAL